jgi:hypothetical protein
MPYEAGQIAHCGWGGMGISQAWKRSIGAVGALSLAASAATLPCITAPQTIVRRHDPQSLRRLPLGHEQAISRQQP